MPKLDAKADRSLPNWARGIILSVILLMALFLGQEVLMVILDDIMGPSIR